MWILGTKKETIVSSLTLKTRKMAESTDKQTRKIAEKRVEKGKEFEGYQEAQNQLLAIQAEQKQNLALQANEAATMSAQNQTLGQAAEIMAVDEPTQNILSGYGLNQPRVIKNSDVQKQGPNNITINNTTINNTLGPVQGREISIRPQENNQGKFKAWLTNVFARQDAEWQKRNQEYTKRESSLTRNANKMMRKIEGLGKEIGNAVDPRKASQRASNSTMNLLKALGLLYFAKKLPSILEFFNGAEGKIRGWISDIGDKIKEGVSGIFGTKDKDGFFNNLIHSLYNEEETGILNKLFKSIGNWISEHANYASEKTGSMTSWFGLPEGEKVAKWLQLFFGGPNANVSITRRKIIENIRDNEFKDKAVRSSSQQENWTGNYQLSTNSTGRFGVSRTDGGITESYFSMGGNNDWANWKKANGITNATDKDASRFFREKGYAYTAEAYILLKSTWNITQGRIFSEKYDLTALGTLPPNTVYPQLAASLEIIREYKRGIRIDGNSKVLSNTNVIFFLLDLLVKKASSNGHVTVFEEFLKCIAKDTRIPQLKKDGLIKERQYKLVMEPMTPADQNRYMSSDRILMSNYYKKLVPIDGENKEQALTLAEEDYRGISRANNWTFIEITHSGLGTILEEATGTKSIDFSRDQKKKFMDTFRTNIKSINHGIDLGTNYFTYDDTSKDFENFFEASQEKKDYDYQREEERKRREAERHSANYSASERNSFSSSNYSTLDENGKLITKKITKEEKESNSRKVFDALKKEGFTDEQAAGISGVLRHESAGFNPAAINAKEFKDGLTGYGEGLAQWSNERKKTFESWWKQKNVGKEFPGIHKLPIEDQIEFLLHEFKQRRVYNDIKSLSESNGLSKEDIIKQSTDLFTRGFENGSTSGYSSIEAMENTYRNKHKHWKSYEDTILAPRLNYASGIYNSYVGKLSPTSTSQQTSISNPTISPKNPNNQINSITGNRTTYRPNGTTGFAPELDEFSEVFEPTTITPTENSNNYTTTPMSSSSPTQTFAESIVPIDKSQDGTNNSNPFGSQEGFAKFSGQVDYLCMGVEALVNNSAVGFNMMASAYTQGNQPRNLTPGVSPLEDNIT